MHLPACAHCLPVESFTQVNIQLLDFLSFALIAALWGNSGTQHDVNNAPISNTRMQRTCQLVRYFPNEESTVRYVNIIDRRTGVAERKVSATQETPAATIRAPAMNKDLWQ